MKKKTDPRLILVIALILLLAIAAIGMLIYEYISTKALQKASVLRTLLILAGAAFSLSRLYTKRKGGYAPSVLRKRYGDLVGDAFPQKTKESKCFFAALNLYCGKRFAEAQKLLQGISTASLPNQEAFSVFVFTALCYHEAGQYQNAIKSYEEALELQENLTVASNLGLCYQRLGKDKKAVKAYERAIAIDPVNAYPYNNLAQLYIRQKNYEKALEFAKKATALDTKFHQAYAAQAVCYAVMGNREHYENALAVALQYGADKSDIEKVARSLGATV